jgi:hypothetical protein
MLPTSLKGLLPTLANGSFRATFVLFKEGDLLALRSLAPRLNQRRTNKHF